MKWFKENAGPFLLTATAAAVGAVLIAPLIQWAIAKFNKKTA